MTDHHVYKHIEVTGTSAESIEAAIDNAVTRAASSLHKLRWFQLIETRGAIDGNRVAEWQVTVKIAFTLDES